MQACALYSQPAFPCSDSVNANLTFQAIEQKSKRGQCLDSYQKFERVMNHDCESSVGSHERPTQFSIFNTNTLLQTACNFVEISCSNDISCERCPQTVLTDCMLYAGHMIAGKDLAPECTHRNRSSCDTTQEQFHFNPYSVGCGASCDSSDILA